MTSSESSATNLESDALHGTGIVLAGLRSAESFLQEHSSIPAFVRDRPAAAIGVAFGAGFLLASMGHRPRRWVLRSAYRRAGRAVVAGLGAVALAEARRLLTDSDDSDAVIE